MFNDFNQAPGTSSQEKALEECQFDNLNHEEFGCENNKIILSV